MKKLYVLRHGETEHNVWTKDDANKENMYHLENVDDTLLTEDGRNQAREAGERFIDTQVDFIFCSPSLRTRETLEIFYESARINPITKTHYDGRIVEKIYGSEQNFDRLHLDAKVQLYGGGLREHNNKMIYDNRPFGGEHWQDTESRVREFLNDLVKIPQNASILICTHYAITRFIHKILLEHISPTVHHNLTIKNCSISEFIIS